MHAFSAISVPWSNCVSEGTSVGGEVSSAALLVDETLQL